jgi:hypothetical protein
MRTSYETVALLLRVGAHRGAAAPIDTNLFAWRGAVVSDVESQRQSFPTMSLPLTKRTLKYRFRNRAVVEDA